MYVFSSLQAARNAGFQWYTYNAEYKLHVVEFDRMNRRGQREKALAFARPSDNDIDLGASR